MTDVDGGLNLSPSMVRGGDGLEAG